MSNLSLFEDKQVRRLIQSYSQSRTPVFRPVVKLEFKEAQKMSRLAPNLPEKLERQRQARKLEIMRDEAWRSYD